MDNTSINEVWKDIKDYENIYQVSDLGRIKSLARFEADFNGVLQNIKNNLI